MVSYYSLFIISSTFASFALILNVSALILHFFLPKLLKHPASLIILHMFCQLAVIPHWFITYPEKIHSISSQQCLTVSICSVFFYYAGCFYILFLCLEVYIILRYKAYKTANIRLVLYNISAVLFSALISFTFYITHSLGKGVYHTCFLSSGSVGQYIDAVYHFLFITFLIISYYLIKEQLGCCYSPVFNHLTRLILVLAISLSISRVFALVLILQKGYSSEFQILGSIFSILCLTVISAARMLHPKIREKLKEVFRTKTLKQLELAPSETDDELLKSILRISIDADSDDLADMFDRLGHKIIIQILVLLTIKYTIEEGFSGDLSQALEEFRGKKDQKNYSEALYAEIAVALKMPFIDKVFCPDVSLIEYESGTFDLIRKSIGFDREVMLDSLMSYENLRALSHIGNKGGQSNAFFYSSANEKIVIKTINGQECSSFLKFLPEYSKRVISHPESKLIRILGLFRVLPHKQDFIIMENGIVDKKNCLIFDLKGSTVGRFVGGFDSENPPNGIVLKDLNFKRYGKKLRLKNRNEVIKTILADMRILRNSKLMDYSMIVGEYKESCESRYAVSQNYSLATIDFFQRYGFKKSVERVFKRYILRKNKGISVSSPNRYYERIKKYLRDITEDENEI